MLRCALMSSVVMLATASALRAEAQPSIAPTAEQLAAAGKLADEGLAAFETGHDEEAFDRFTRAEALVHAPPHLLYQARAAARRGRLRAAKALYAQVLAEVLFDTAPPPYFRAQAEAKREAALLEERLPRIRIDVRREGTLDASVRVDDVPLPAASWGQPLELDPGTHHVVLVSRSGRSVSQPIVVAEGERRTVELRLPGMPGRANTVRPSAGEPNGASSDRPGVRGRDARSFVAATVTMFVAAGVASAVSVTTFALAASKQGSLSDDCLAGRVCSESERDQGASSNLLRYVSFLTGAAAIHTGISGGVLVYVGTPAGSETASGRRSHGATVQLRHVF
ncbi:MAG: hypothetical protein WKG00_24145 [Polyangiaceae bacterium]